MLAVVHVNPGTQWQPRYGAALVNGLHAAGIDARVSHNRSDREELTFVLGPNWCKSRHENHPVLYIDRAFWGDPDAVSIYWLDKGEKLYDWTPREGRWHPTLQPMKAGPKVVTLCDYGKTFHVDHAQTVRKHPSEEPAQETLSQCLARHDAAVGGRSTALVDAAIGGLRVTTLMPNSPVTPISGQASPDRLSWIRALSWHNWTYDEIENGAPWDHFIKSKH